MSSLLAALILFAFVLVFGLFLVWVAGLFGPKLKYNKVKQEPYECGILGQDTGNTEIPVKFYLTAILFILFDIEIIFMYPWAVSFIEFIQAGGAVYILSVIGIFLLIFVYGLFWEIKSNALEWE
jgi:NADH-quinone oxidoreductase subunit A